jgi:hypothetical protein
MRCVDEAYDSVPLVLLIITVLFKSSKAESAPGGELPPPVIVSAEQADEKTVHIKWRVDRSKISSPSRYKVFYKESGQFHFNEWPGMILI